MWLFGFKGSAVGQTAFPALASSGSHIKFTSPFPHCNPIYTPHNYVGYLTILKSSIVSASASSIPENTYFCCAKHNLQQAPFARAGPGGGQHLRAEGRPHAKGWPALGETPGHQENGGAQHLSNTSKPALHL